jgi:transposase InsO family protein
LGDYGIELNGLDLQQLLGKDSESFIVPTKIAQNGYSVAVQALIDTGANGFAFIDTKLAVMVAQFFGIHTEALDSKCAVRGYDGKSTNPITHAITLNLVVDGHRQLATPMLIVDLGRYDIILGKKWLAKFDVMPSCKLNRLIWPEETTLLDEVSTKCLTPLPKRILQRKERIKEEHQEDADRRDKLMEREIRRERYRPPRTFLMDYRNGLNKMDRALNQTEESIPPKQVKRRNQDINDKSSIRIDIALIGAAAFHLQATKKGSEAFVTSLYEIEKLIDDRKGEIDFQEEKENILSKLPSQYHQYADVFSKIASDKMPPDRPCNHKIELEEGSLPTRDIGHSPLYKQNLEELEAARKYIIENLDKGFIAPNQAPFASPILMAKMPSGKLRFCVDYRKLNAITKKDRYPLPLIDELMERLSRAKIFTKLDIRQGFHRIRIDPESQDLTTFKTRYGTFKYKVVPFGLTNGPATFQRLINEIFMDCLDDFLTAYIDDLLIYSNDELEHQAHVKLVLERLRAAGLQASIDKCEFHVKRTKYLGFIVTTEGIEVDPEKVKVITDWKVPTTVKGVQSFLGFCNFYRRFIRNFSRIIKSLVRLVKKDTPFLWSSECERAFADLKKSLTTAPVLRHYDPELPTKLETDAADGVVAGVMSQFHGNEWHPIAYYSKTMSGPELNYEIHDKEMLAIIRALENWRAELSGLQREDRFDIYTDHKALEYFMTKRRLNSRQARWGQLLSDYHFLIRYRPGKENTLADALTRREGGEDFSETIKSKEEFRTQVLLKPECVEKRRKSDQNLSDNLVKIAVIDSELQITDRVLQANRNSLTLEEYRKRAEEVDNTDWSIEHGLLLFKDRIFVPDEGDLRARLLDEVHRQKSTAHPGRDKTKELIRPRYYWDNWAKDITRYVDNCMTCKRNNTRRDKPPGLLHPLPIPDRPWQHVTMDFRSFPKDKDGYDAAFVIVDRLSKKPLSLPCHKTTTAEDMARMYIETIYRWKGPPDTIVSDRGGQFISKFWDEFCRILGVKLRLSTSHYPQADGQTEILNQYIAQRLRPFINYYQDNWSELLPMMDFAAGILRHDTTGVSPFLVDNGYEPRTSFDWHNATPPKDLNMDRQKAQDLVRHMEKIQNMAKAQMEKSQKQQKAQADKHRREIDFDIGDEVLITTRNWNLGQPSKKLGPQAAGPYKILRKVGQAFELELPETIKVHPLFAPEKLRRASSTEPLQGQIKDLEDPIEIDGQEEWEIEEIVAVRLRRQRLEYRARWVGQEEDLTWYPARNFRNSAYAIKDFHERYPDLPGPPGRLDEWLKATEKDEFLEDHEEDDRPKGWHMRQRSARIGSRS